jgi:long-chain fatty acid transport protein
MKPAPTGLPTPAVGCPQREIAMSRSPSFRPFAILLAVVAPVVLLEVRPARGGGIEVPMQGARAAGQADAFTAQADDPSAIFYNPAGLTQLQGTQVSAGLYFLQPQWKLEADSGAIEHMNLATWIPHFYAATDFGLERWRFGLGVNNPFGINENWGDSGSLRQIVDQAQLMVINIAPAVSYKLNDNLSVGAAFNIYAGSLVLTRNVVLGPPPFPEGEFHFRGNAYSFGFTPGVLWKINEQHSIGAYYRSAFTMDFKGKAKVSVAGMDAAGPSDADASLDFPQSIGGGYAFRPIPTWKIEADVIWTDWHTLDRLRFESDDPNFDGQTLPADWRSGFTYRLGTEYQLDENWFLRAGYAYGQNSVPTATFSPIVPDSNYHLLAAGIGYSTPGWSFDIAGQYIYREKHHVEGSVNSPLVDGDWTNNMYGIMATLTLKF